MELGSPVASGALRARGGRPRPLCRNFARGSCRWGQSCRFAHDRKSAQICRYFQSGFCSYGERCSYQHIQEEPVGSQWGHEPPMPPGRRGSELVCLPQALARSWGGARCRSAPAEPSATQLTFRFPRVQLEEEEEEDKENVPAPDNPPSRAVDGECVPAGAQGASSSRPGGLGLQAAPSGMAMVETATWAQHAEAAAEAGEAARRARSEAVVCGICMDRVYEKALPEERLFGILPNCAHAYCLGCIRKWRRSRDFQTAVIKACPECRVTSSYYIPHKYWVSEADEKQKLIEAFKARTGKIRCKFFVRSHGHCPFKSDCIYLHEFPPGWTPRRRQRRPRIPELDPALSESSDEEDEELCILEWALTLALMEADGWYSTYGQQSLFTDLSDSD
ncbi:probable E3 ubiquitin-protein ligase makorin-2 [Apteryx rowi]|uniref:probable E3 ubiquitin-protein ligase makorin-2 n=1 Tax=Apteryx rowi TaxID=308060 RepID=UPI000E1D4804|nr:probable E3 ubiquitin-protein ligase makorin-2 [Apteryx rowi]